MTKRTQEWVSGLVLHTRPYRETSLLVEAFTESFGRVSLVYRGAKSTSGKNNKARLLQPFQPLTFLWQGDRELKTGTKVEPAGAGFLLFGTALYSAMYLNELIVRLLLKEEPHPVLYRQYIQTLGLLKEVQQDNAQIEIFLREFELTLLAELGYELVLDMDASFTAIDADLHYAYDPEAGFNVAFKKIDPAFNRMLFSGQQLLAISQQQWQDAETRKAAKRLLRLALAPHLGDKPLESRQLFKPLTKS
ncbi:MAG: DNA repair protein RecO [Pseudomonadales bacterium]|nr:DNA repair protein RecO [Pseudomonadales bacterium]